MTQGSGVTFELSHLKIGAHSYRHQTFLKQEHLGAWFLQSCLRQRLLLSHNLDSPISTFVSTLAALTFVAPVESVLYAGCFAEACYYRMANQKVHEVKKQEMAACWGRVCNLWETLWFGQQAPDHEGEHQSRQPRLPCVSTSESTIQGV